MKVIPVRRRGTHRVVLRDSVAPFGGGDWGDDGQIYFTHNNREPRPGGVRPAVPSPRISRSGLRRRRRGA